MKCSKFEIIDCKIGRKRYCFVHVLKTTHHLYYFIHLLTTYLVVGLEITWESYKLLLYTALAEMSLVALSSPLRIFVPFPVLSLNL